MSRDVACTVFDRTLEASGSWRHFSLQSPVPRASDPVQSENKRRKKSVTRVESVTRYRVGDRRRPRGHRPARRATTPGPPTRDIVARLAQEKVLVVIALRRSRSRIQELTRHRRNSRSRNRSSRPMSRDVACINFVAHLDPRAPIWSLDLGARRVHRTLGAMDHFAQQRDGTSPPRRSGPTRVEKEDSDQSGGGDSDSARASSAPRGRHIVGTAGAGTGAVGL